MYMARRCALGLDKLAANHQSSSVWFLFSQDLASADHTTLLLNCYTKLKDVEKLDAFIHCGTGDDDSPRHAATALKFDAETAVKVDMISSMFHEVLWLNMCKKCVLEILSRLCQHK